MIDARRIDFVAQPVSDLGRADAFYGETLGLPRNPNTSGDRWVEYETGNLTLALSRFGGAVAIGVADVDAARATLEEAGVEFHGETFDSGVCNGAPFTAPDGNRLLLHRRYAPLEPYDKPATEVLRTDFVSMPVPDLEQAKSFYGKTLGIPQNPRANESYPEFETENVTIELLATSDESTPSIALRVPDVAAARGRLEEKGVEFDGETFDTGVCHVAFFGDPDGNRLALHRRYAPYSDGSTP